MDFNFMSQFQVSMRLMVFDTDTPEGRQQVTPPPQVVPLPYQKLET